MEACFATMFEKAKHERTFILLQSLTDPDILKESPFTDHEIISLKNLALEKVHRQLILKSMLPYLYLNSIFV